MGVGPLSVKHTYSVGNGGIVAVVDEVCLPVRRRCDNLRTRKKIISHIFDSFVPKKIQTLKGVTNF